MRKKGILFLSAVSAAFLIGCGGGGSSSSDSNKEVTINGAVIGSYYEGAKICFDTDNDGSCSGEDSVSSDENGEFTITGPANTNLIAVIDEGAKKHQVIGDSGVDINASTKTIFAMHYKSFDLAKSQGKGKAYISVFSTKLYTYIKQNPNVDVTTALNTVGEEIGVDKNYILSNFNDSSIDPVIRTQLINKNREMLSLIEGADSLSSVEISLRTYIGAYQLPSRIEVISK